MGAWRVRDDDFSSLPSWHTAVTPSAFGKRTVTLPTLAMPVHGSGKSLPLWWLMNPPPPHFLTRITIPQTIHKPWPLSSKVKIPMKFNSIIVLYEFHYLIHFILSHSRDLQDLWLATSLTTNDTIGFRLKANSECESLHFVLSVV